MSNSTPQQFSSKTPGETVRLRFNFARLTAAPTNPVWTVERLAGPADPNPAAMREGTPTVVGPRALQLMKAGVDGTDYLVTCTVQAGDEIYTLQGVLPVRAQP